MNFFSASLAFAAIIAIYKPIASGRAISAPGGNSQGEFHDPSGT
jgi:hypothetical protein